MKKQQILIISIITLFFSACSGGEDTKSNSAITEEINNFIEENTTTPKIEDENKSDEVVIIPPIIKPLYLSGVAIDGYVSGGNVSIYEKTTKKLLASTVTDENGSWKLSADQNFSEETFVKITGGTDIATGGSFEGLLQSSVVGDKKAISTPLSTVVLAHLINQKSFYSSGVAIDSLGRKVKNTDTTLQTEDELWEILADKIGVSKEVFENDPIADLDKNSSTSKESAKVVKNLLMVQKNIELMSKSVATENNFNEVFSSVAVGVGKTLLKPKPLYLSGIAIDGYLSNGKVLVYGKESGKLLYETETDKAGNWKIELEEKPNEETYVKIIGGTDRSTGQPFEGNLQSSVAIGTKAISNPLSTLVTAQLLKQKSLYSSGVAIDSLGRKTKSIDESLLYTEDELWDILAKKVGVEKEILTSDTLRKIDENSSDTEKHSTVLKTMLMVQKNSEMITKSIANNETKDAVFDSVNIGMAKTFFPVKKPFYLSGVAIDGYLDGGKVQVFGKESGKLLFETETDSEGNWEIGFDEEPNEETYVKIVGGIDISTGESFEGNLQASAKIGEKSIANPLSTLVTTQLFAQKSLYSSGVAIDSLGRQIKTVEKTEDELWEHLAEQIGVDVADLKSDTLKKLDENSSDSPKHAKVLKTMLMIQKNSEMITKSVANNETKEAVFESVNLGMASTLFKPMYLAGVAVDSLGRKIQNTDQTFDEMLLSSSDSILEETANALVESGVVSEEEKNSVSAKLTSSKNALETVTKSLNSIDESVLANGGANEVGLVSKSLEIVSSKLESSLEEVAKISNDDPDFANALENNTKNLEKTAGAITVSGGINGIKNVFKSSLENLEEGKTIDVSSFSAVLSDEVIEANSQIYDKLVESGVSPDSILEASSQNAESGEETSLLETISANSPELSENLSALNEEISALENSAKESLANSVSATMESAVVDIPEEEDFGDELLNSADSILEETANELVESGVVSEDEKNAVSSKLESSKDALKTVTESLASATVGSGDVEALAKSLEIVSSKLESALEEIAKIPTDDPDFESAMAESKSAIEKTSSAISETGGISAIQNVLASSLSNLEDGKTVDISKLDLLSDDVLEGKVSLDDGLSSSLENAVVESEFSDDDLIVVEETELSLEDTLLQSSAEILSESANALVESGVFTEDQKSSVSAKLDASKDSLASVTKMMKSINPDSLSNGIEELQVVSQSLEIVTAKVEKVLASIATIPADDPTFAEQIATAQTETEKTVGAIVITGGIDGIANAIESAGEGADLENLISDDVLEANAQIYESLVEAGVSPDTILEASTVKAKSTTEETTSILDEIAKIDTTSSLDSLKEEISQLESEAKESLENSIIENKVVEETPDTEIDTGTEETPDTEIDTGTEETPDTGTEETPDTGTEETPDTEIEENTNTTVTTPKTPTQVYYLNKWWSYTDYIKLISFMKETPPPAMTDNNIINAPETNTTVSFEEDFRDDVETLDQDFEEVSDLDSLNEMFFEEDFTDISIAIATMMDFEQFKDFNGSLEEFKTLVFSEEFLAVDENLETLKTLFFFMDFSNPDENLERFIDIMFSQNFSEVSDIQHLRDLIFNLDFQKQDENLSEIRDIFFSYDFKDVDEVENLKDLLFNLDFSVQDENLEDLKNLFFSFDILDVEEMEKLKDLFFELDFSEQTELAILKDLIFNLDFSVQDENLVDLKDLLFSADFRGFDNSEDLHDLIFSLDFENFSEISNLKELIFNIDFSQQNEDLEKNRDMIFAIDFKKQQGLEKLTDLIFNIDFQNQNTELEKIRELLFSEDFDTVIEIEKLKSMFFALDFAEKDENLVDLKEMIFSTDFQKQEEIDKLRTIFFFVDFQNQDENLTALKEMIFNTDFTGVEEEFEKEYFSDGDKLDFEEQDENLTALKEMIFNTDFTGVEEEEFEKEYFSDGDKLDFEEQPETSEDKIDIQFSCNFESIENLEETSISDIVYPENIGWYLNVDISSALNADGIKNVGDTSEDGLDSAERNLFTEGYKTDGDGLPDDGYFAGNSYHDGIQLDYNNDDNGYNIVKKDLNSGTTALTSFKEDVYSAIHIFALSSEGGTGLSVKAYYSDGTSKTSSVISVPDWASTITESTEIYYVASSLDAFHQDGAFDDVNYLNIFGFKFEIDHSKILTRVDLIPNVSGSAYQAIFGVNLEGENILGDIAP
ncbi:hypothetical protein ThvES_00011710 [Thiovulum sp. ES]|nr:hypothetical protein ThvES_00011710 [Thiovulum sp. ES]